jgi:hypothetical protein
MLNSAEEDRTSDQFRSATDIQQSIAYPECEEVSIILSEADDYAKRANTHTHPVHVLYALTRNQAARAVLERKKVDVGELSKRLYAQIYPHTSSEHIWLGDEAHKWDLLNLRLRAARIAASDRKPTVDVENLLQAFAEESREQKANEPPLWAALRACWEPARYVDPLHLARAVAQELLKAYQDQQDRIERKLDAIGVSTTRRRGLLGF